MLHGHDRSITQIRYNLEGDLLFSVAKDSKPTVWYSSNGERLGTFNGHNGAIWCIDISRIHLLTVFLYLPLSILGEG
jgi:translation initiation factor 3 subunit I